MNESVGMTSIPSSMANHPAGLPRNPSQSNPYEAPNPKFNPIYHQLQQKMPKSASHIPDHSRLYQLQLDYDS